MTIKLNISSRELDNKVKHIPFNTIHLNEKKKKTETFMKVNVGEVKNNRFIKAGALVSGLTMSMLPKVAHGEAIETTENVQQTITPAEVLEYGLTIGKMGVGIAVGMSIVMLTFTGILMMLKQKQKSKEWTSDIIKGLVHCLVAIPVVFAIYYISTSLFGSIDFTNPTFLNTP